MKILLTCGGTAGHINPAVALARMFQERMEDSQVLFVGARLPAPALWPVLLHPEEDDNGF